MNDTIKLQNQSGALTLNPQDIAEATEWEEFVTLWTVSQEIDIANQWYKGDIADRVAVVHGDNSLYKFAEEVKESPRTMEHYRRVARAFPDKDMRNWNLTWTHYLIASFADSYNKGSRKFDTEERFKWLENAHDNAWSTTRLQAEIKKQKVITDTDDFFQYYMNYLSNNVRNVLLHVEKKSLTNEEKDKLIHKLLDVYNEFQVYMREP